MRIHTQLLMVAAAGAAACTPYVQQLRGMAAGPGREIVVFYGPHEVSIPATAATSTLDAERLPGLTPVFDTLVGALRQARPDHWIRQTDRPWPGRMDGWESLEGAVVLRLYLGASYTDVGDGLLRLSLRVHFEAFEVAAGRLETPAGIYRRPTVGSVTGNAVRVLVDAPDVESLLTYYPPRRLASNLLRATAAEAEAWAAEFTAPATPGSGGRGESPPPP